MADKEGSEFENLLTRLEEVELTTMTGRITEVVGMLIKAVVPQVRVGEVCLIKREGPPLLTEVVGFTQEEVFLSPLGEMTGIGPSSEVIPTRLPLHIKVGPELLGRVLNGLGEPLDLGTKGPLNVKETYPIFRAPPDPLKRKRILEPISTGVRCIDGLLTCGRGQKIGIFAGSGVGKSVLLGMMCRQTEADVTVLALIGERGREVKEFIEKELGEEGLKRTVVIAATSDQPPLVRLRGAFIATAIAEYFRDQGQHVLLLIDRKSVVEGKSVDLGGRRIIKKKK